MEPGKTSFFQALGVPTKIARGTIEITTDLKLVEAGTKVGPSEATLLNMLNISPFTYGLGVSQVYDQGNTFPPDVLDIGEEQLLKTFTSAITTIAALSLALNFPTLPSVIHSLVNSYKKVLAVAIETEISWPEIEQLKDRIANPDAYASSAPAAAAAETTTAAAAEEEKKEEEEEESGDEGFGGLLYVPLSSREFHDLTWLTSNLFSATKCLSMVTVLSDWHQTGLGLGFQDLDVLNPSIHRSLNGQLRHVADELCVLSRDMVTLQCLSMQQVLLPCKW